MTVIDRTAEDAADFQIGDRRVHPQYGVIILTSRRHQEAVQTGALWQFTVEETGERHSGYGVGWLKA